MGVDSVTLCGMITGSKAPGEPPDTTARWDTCIKEQASHAFFDDRILPGECMNRIIRSFVYLMIVALAVAFQTGHAQNAGQAGKPAVSATIAAKKPVFA